MRIGLSQRVLLHKNRAYDSLDQGWYHYLKGHTLFAIPNNPDQDFGHIAKELDAFISQGVEGLDDALYANLIDDPEFRSAYNIARKEMNELNENYKPDFDSKGYKMAQKVITQLQSSVFPKLDNDELYEFRQAIADAFNLKNL